LVHDTVRFEDSAIARLLRELGTCLEWLAAAPDHPPSALPLVEHERAPVVPATALSSPPGAAVAVPAAPRTPAEVTLAGIWSEVLGVQTVGRHDDFFALGGHSLRAMQGAARVRDAFDLELPVATIFQAPTLAQLAERIEAAGGIGPDGTAVVPPLRARSAERHGARE
jgi:acyl carrier protein